MKHAQASRVEMSLATRMAACCCRSATTALAAPIPRVVPAWPAWPTALRLWAARSTSTARPGPGRISRWIFHSSTSWLRVPVDANCDLAAIGWGITHGQVFGTPVAEYLPPRPVRECVALAGDARTSPRRSDCPACGPRRERRFGGDGGTAPPRLHRVLSGRARGRLQHARPARVLTWLTGRPDALLAGSRIGRQPGRNKGSHAPSWNSRELRVTHERCRSVLWLRPLRSLSQASAWLTARTGSIKRVAAAVGEGSSVIQSVHQYLTKFPDGESAGDGP